ncbi:hypothetical protein JHK82_051301 [Glycine max]|uniref:Uncharacterized protein n=2 Tax=Glycine subgen. Soja TaxID=1462606 RepID=K7MU05_SOYBN|nr:hypothetical protein JHK86_051143 [Glycine max]RZB53648.1 hypothetical protein D0Y65_049544 [Glycine soja]KAG4937088.1 hypothetical protein JHK85_052007 [Glycine max]KAG5092523.1 hypothetical protein JHK82_051301 [Glycine max]KAG5095595.1 hypothetical protein JHK84_051183 [Glycine max]
MERGVVAFVGLVSALYGEMTHVPLSLSSVFFKVFKLCLGSYGTLSCVCL